MALRPLQAEFHIARKLTLVNRKLDLIMQHLGLPEFGLSDAQLVEVDELLRNDQKIKAIKIYRELVPDASLVEAKHIIDRRAQQI
ncbi:hypothetical protein [Nocardia pseudobrasiliensis]|uniref:Uncharacterized protein n=1 Tax=Nocardia pseudobrasiliensis TaxID=45979 RepID=A0A370IBV0_9NOCA|nr:hypothetical protein [Nocardia pseudobrasiliensis]RDI68202.1 hypothetical protein DFR76_102603 [Nocardia pseudobrasiliensis]